MQFTWGYAGLHRAQEGGQSPAVTAVRDRGEDDELSTAGRCALLARKSVGTCPVVADGQTRSFGRSSRCREGLLSRDTPRTPRNSGSQGTAVSEYQVNASTLTLS